jgi:hypothetical protein
MDASEIDRELDELQSKTELLRALYEQYFMGFERTEPLAQRKDVERRVKNLRRAELRNTAQRFKLNTLVQRFNTMQQHWTRVVREIENGTYRRDVIRAAARFGEGALTVLGQKKTRGVAAAIAKAQAGRSVEGTFELAAADLIEDEDDAPTPPKLGAPPPNPRSGLPTMGAPPPNPRSGLPPTSGLGQGDLPVVGPPPQQREAAFGEIDLDFDAPPARPAPAAKPLLPLAPPPRAAPPVQVKPPAVNVPPKPPAAPALSGGFGVLDLHLQEDEPFGALPPRPAVPSSPISPGSGIRPGSVPSPGSMLHPPALRPPPVASPPAVARELPDQRLRQIYAQYVATKRSTQESTAGVTFEKLAASLRAQADKLKSAHPNKSVDYEVVVKDGKTHLKPVLK